MKIKEYGTWAISGILSLCIVGLALDLLFLGIAFLSNSQLLQYSSFSIFILNALHTSRQALLYRILTGVILGILFKFFLDRKFFKSNLFAFIFGITVGTLKFLVHIIPVLTEGNIMKLQLILRVIGCRPFVEYVLFSFLLLFIGNFLENKILSKTSLITNSQQSTVKSM